MNRIYFVRRRRPNPLLVAYRWRYEGGSAAALATAWTQLGQPAELATGGAVAAGVVAAAWAPSRALLIRGAQHVVVQHRLRTGFVQAGLANRDGRLPRLLHTRTRGEVVTVLVWLPAGITPEDLADSAGLLASACGAAEVRVIAASPSRDRVRVVVARPRWGVPGR